MVVNYFQFRPDTLVYLIKAGFTKERKRTVATRVYLTHAGFAKTNKGMNRKKLFFSFPFTFSRNLKILLRVKMFYLATVITWMVKKEQ